MKNATKVLLCVLACLAVDAAASENDAEGSYGGGSYTEPDPTGPCAEYLDTTGKRCIGEDDNGEPEETDQSCNSFCQNDFITEVKTLCASDENVMQLLNGVSGICEKTPEKPTYNPDDFDADAYSVAQDISSITFPPTPVPTPSPTVAGFAVVTTVVEKKAVSVPISFPVTLEDAKNPVMQKALSTGFARSIGEKPENVWVGAVGGEEVSQSRRRLSGVEITFVVLTRADDTTELTTNIQEAATEGSLVANVQKAADQMNVLVPALKDMPLVLAEPVVTVTTTQVTVTNLVAVAPSPGPTPGFSGASATSVSSICLALVLVQAVMVALF